MKTIFYLSKYFANIIKYNILFSFKKVSTEIDLDTIVSVTSYKKRINTRFILSLKSLLFQSKRPLYIVVYLTDLDFENHFYFLESYFYKYKNIVKFKKSFDYLSYKKITPPLKDFPNKFIVTADDDIIYPFDWFKRLSENKSKDFLVFFRSHSFSLVNKSIPDYNLWNFEKYNTLEFNCPTTGAGICFFNGLIEFEDYDYELIKKYFSTCDDLFLFYLLHKKNIKIKFIGKSNLIFLYDPILKNYNLNNINLIKNNITIKYLNENLQLK